MTDPISFYVQVFRQGDPAGGERVAAAHVAEAYGKAKEMAPGALGTAAVGVHRDRLTSDVKEVAIIATFGAVPPDWSPSD